MSQELGKFTSSLIRQEKITETGDMNMQDQQQDPVSVADVEKQHPSGYDFPIQAAGLEEKDPNIIDWDGDNDPENPRNWPTRKKWTNAGLLSAMTLVT